MSLRHQSDNRADAFSVTSDMTSAQDALELLLKDIKTISGTEQVNLRNALGRVLAEPVKCDYNIPPFDNSAVDGYAVRYQDLSDVDFSTLPIVARIVAGAAPDTEIKANEAAQILTGAPIPAGADTIIPFEVCDVRGELVTLPVVKKAGQNIRLAGEDVKAQSIILKSGIGLRPQDIALAASAGKNSLPVHKKLSIGIFSTGSEILDPSDSKNLHSGLRFDSNRYLLMGLCDKLGCEVTDLGILKDDKDLIKSVFQDAQEKYDLILTSGGVSSSEEDHVKHAFEAAGGHLDLWKVAIRPGRPLAWGKIGKTYFMGLPGNPVAAFVTFSMFTRPLILKMAGLVELNMLRVPVKTSFEIKKRVGRREWLRVWLKRGENNQLFAEKFPSEGSGILSSLVVTDGLLELPDELDFVHEGDILDFLPFTELSTL